MRLLIEEARDHTECMEKLRARFGADCVVVHSFKTDDRYRVIVALESPLSDCPQAPTDRGARNEMAQDTNREPIFWLAEDSTRRSQVLEGSEIDGCAGSTVAQPQQRFSDQKNHSLPQEITAELVALAARVKALESAQFQNKWESEPQAVRDVIFSDVLKDVTESSIQDNGLAADFSPDRPKYPEAKNIASGQQLQAADVSDSLEQDRDQSTLDSANKDLPRPLSNVSLADEAEGFKNASKGAASFAALLTDHVTSSRSRSFMPHFGMTATGH